MCVPNVKKITHGGVYLVVNPLVVAVLIPKESIEMKKDDLEHPKSSPQKEAPAAKKEDELHEDELNKATGGLGVRKSGGDTKPVGFPF